jgi:hypothetical protein
MESLFAAAQSALSKFGYGSVVIDLRALIEAKDAKFPAVLSPSISANGSVLSLTGAAYRAKNPPEMGLHYLSWNENDPPGTLWVRLAFAEPSFDLTTSNQWEAISAKCSALLAAIS